MEGDKSATTERLGTILACGHWTDMERPPGFVEMQDVFYCFVHGIQPIIKINVPKPPKGGSDA